MFGGGGGNMGRGSGDKSLAMPLLETMRLAWADPDLRARILFVLGMFGVFALGVNIPVPVPGISSEEIWSNLSKNPQLDLMNLFSGGSLRRVSIFALGLGPYITASIILQVLTTAYPQWKKEQQEGGDYARKQQNKRTRALTFVLCAFQGWGLLALIAHYGGFENVSTLIKVTTVIFWTAGAMFMLWLGEQISEKGIGNGVSLMIFAGILFSIPQQFERLWNGLNSGAVQWWQVAAMGIIFLATTWIVVLFTIAQRRIPIQHMRRMVGTKMLGGQTSYLPLSVNMVGVIPIIFAASLIYIPGQIAIAFGGPTTPVGSALTELQSYLSPASGGIKSVIGVISYAILIFFFTYFYTAVQYNVEDISNNLKRGGSFIPGVRPGKQTKDFLDGVISRITVVGAVFLSVVAMTQYIAPWLTQISYTYVSVISGTSLLIIVSVALETMRQIEANLLMKQYGN